MALRYRVNRLLGAGGDECGAKIICGLKSSDIDQIDELIDYSYRHDASMFRKMHFSMIEFEDCGERLRDYVDLDRDATNWPFSEQEAADILLGRNPSWEMVKAYLYPTGLLFFFYRFDDDGKVEDTFFFCVDIPTRMTFRITVERSDDHVAETYVITYIKENQCCAYEYYENSVKKYDGIICDDDRGKGCEIIMESE